MLVVCLFISFYELMIWLIKSFLKWHGIMWITVLICGRGLALQSDVTLPTDPLGVRTSHTRFPRDHRDVSNQFTSCLFDRH